MLINTAAWRSGQRSGLRTRPQWNPGSNPGAATACVAEQQTRPAQDRCPGLPLVQVQPHACPGARTVMGSPAKRDFGGATPPLGMADIAKRKRQRVEIPSLVVPRFESSCQHRVRGVEETSALGMRENGSSILPGSIGHVPQPGPPELPYKEMFTGSNPVVPISPADAKRPPVRWSVGAWPSSYGAALTWRISGVQVSPFPSGIS